VGADHGAGEAPVDAQVAGEPVEVGHGEEVLVVQADDRDADPVRRPRQRRLEVGDGEHRTPALQDAGDGPHEVREREEVARGGAGGPRPAHPALERVGVAQAGQPQDADAGAGVGRREQVVGVAGSEEQELVLVPQALDDGPNPRGVPAPLPAHAVDDPRQSDGEGSRRDVERGWLRRDPRIQGWADVVPERYRAGAPMLRRALCHLRPDGALAPGPGSPDAPRLWPYTQDRRWPVRVGREAFLDPINAVLLDASPARVMAGLAGRGWCVPSTGQVHRTWLDGRLVEMDAHTALGTHEERVHVRLWALGPVTLAAAHHERRAALGLHRVISWDAARAQLLADLVLAGWAVAGPAEQIVRPGMRGLPGDGRAWGIRAPAVVRRERAEAAGSAAGG
jgi:hypothetical protein